MTKESEKELKDIVMDAQDESPAKPEKISDLKKKNEKLEKKLKKLEKQLDEQKEICEKQEKEKDEFIGALKKERAEFENFRKRKTAEAISSFNNGANETVIQILPLLDNLELALENVPEDKKDGDFIKGIENLSKLFRATLEAMNVMEIEALGEPFDHDYHDAMMQVDSEDGEEAGIVKQVLQKGYKTDDKVLRYAKVIVTK